MRLTALCVCGTLLVFASPLWTRADSDEGFLLGDGGFGPCVAILRPEEPCTEGQHEGTCRYILSLPPLTVHLPQQLRDLEKIVEDLQKLKDSVDELREMCADCTVSQTERECGRQREGEHGKLNESNWMNERLQENDFRQECGGDRDEVGTGDGDSEKRLRKEKERKNWEAERERDEGVIKENENKETLRKGSETDGKTQTEGSKGKDKLGQRNVLTAGGNEGTVDTMRERVADKNNRETDRNKDNARKGNSKGYQEDALENGKERKMTPEVQNKQKPGESDHYVWQDETKETETETQTEAGDRIKMSKDNGEHTDEERAQHRDDRKKEMAEGIKVERNNEKLKQTEHIGHTEKERTIKEGAAEGERKETGKEIKTEGEKTESVQRDGDGELASSKAIESTDFVSISPTPHSTIASRPESIDSNKATIFTSSLPSTPLPSSTLDLITDVSHVTVTDYGPNQSTGLGVAHIPEPTSPNSDSATMSTLGGHGQQATSATTRANSRVRPGAGFQDRISTTTTTTIAVPRDTAHKWTAKKNVTSNTKTGEKPVPGRGLTPGERQKPGIKPEADQKQKNPRNDRKPDQAPSPDKSTKYDQKRKPSHHKPTTTQPILIQDPKQDQTSKPDRKTPPGILPVDQNLKNNPRNDRKPDQAPSSDKKTKYDQKQKPSLHKPTTIQPIPIQDPKQDQLSQPDEKTPPGILPVDQNLKNSHRNDRKPDETPSPDKKTKYDQKRKPSHHKSTTIQPILIQDLKQDQTSEPGQKTPPGILPVDQNLKNNPRNDRKPDETPSPDKKTKYDRKQKPSLNKPTTIQPIHIQDPKRDQTSKPDQKTPPGILPTDQNLKNSPKPKNDEDGASDQNKLPIQKPTSHQKPVTPVRRPTFHERPPTVTHSDKYTPVDHGNESDEIPIINPTSKPEKKLVHFPKNDKAVHKQKTEKETKSEENKKPDQRFESNQSPKPFQEPESEGSETASSAPKLNEKPQTEPVEESDGNPSTEPKSNQDLKPGKKITLSGDNPSSDQRPQPSQKIPKTNQKTKPGQVPKPKPKHSKPVTDLKTKPNVNPKTDQAPQTNQSLIPSRPGLIPNLSPNLVPDEVPKAESNKTSKLRPPSRFRPPTRPAGKPDAAPVQRPKPAVQPKPNPKTKTHSDPPPISWTTSDDIQNSQTNMTPTSGPIKPTAEVAHSPEDTEVSPSMRKTITLSPKTSNSLESGPFTHPHGLPEDVTMSPNSRIMSDLRPQTATQPPSIPTTIRPNKITHGIPLSVTPSSSPGSTKPNQMSKSDSRSHTKTLHKVEENTTGQTTTSVPSPSHETTSTLRPDFRSTTSATSGPEPLAVEASTPSARELRVKINQVAAFLNPNGRPPNRYTNEHPKDTQGGSRPDRTEPPTLDPSKVRRDCSDHLLRGETKSGVYLVTPDPRSRSFPVYCDMESYGGGWTLLQRRQDGSVSFNRTWAEYQSGFGKLDGGEFWLGNHMIHLLTRDRDMGLRVDLEDFDGMTEYAQYEQFRVASERLRFRLTVGGYSGTAGDALRFNKQYDHNNRAFTTPDRDNDRYPSGNCGAYYSSGWWFDACMAANLNGRYYVGKYKGVRDGIFWGTWHNISLEYYPTNERQSFKSVRMMIRPKGFTP